MNFPTSRLGQCKTPGGKLAAADVVLKEGRFQLVQIHGDFFIHPECDTRAILAALETALVGTPADLGTPALAARLRAALPFGAELLGTSPEAIAVAVRRAVMGEEEAESVAPLERIGSFSPIEIETLTNSWKELNWRLLPETAMSPAMNVAMDEVLTDRVAAGASTPILRFWAWDASAVIVGRCQSIRNEVDLDEARAMKLQIVRRMTGGGAMFIQPLGAITYSLYLPETAVAGLSIRQSYEVCESWVIQGLRDLGVDAHHVPINDIACSAGKIGGAAQARRRGVVLHHTTMAYAMDAALMVRVLRIGREKLSDKAVTSAAKRVSPLVLQTGRPRRDIAEHLFESFRTRFGGDVGTLQQDEWNDANNLVSKKYENDEWTNEFE